MTKTAMLLTAIVSAFASIPAQAQQRVFVSGLGFDDNPCTVAQPCRTFQQAFNIAPANSEIIVLDPAGYGPLTITHGISIQAHGVGTILATSGNAITVSVTTSDPVSLNGLLLDGGGTGSYGINFTSGPSVQILNSVVRHFQFGIVDQSSTNNSTMLVEDTVASDNAGEGIVAAQGGANSQATLNRITANNNAIYGVDVFGGRATIANSVLSNNGGAGLVVINAGAVAWLAKNVISGNTSGVSFAQNGGPVNSYGDNYIRDNGTPVSGGNLTAVGTQ
jgi:Periplasmic copper-binding protein (NosD)